MSSTAKSMTSLSGWKKVVFASANRKSRFHLENGRLMPLDSWLRLPLTVAERFLGADKERPWIVPSAIRHLDGIIGPDWRVLELGAGSSTKWLAARVGDLRSCETDPLWHRALKSEIGGDLCLVSEEDLPRFLESQAPTSFDLVIVDCSGERSRLLKTASSLLKPGGTLMLDNSDRYDMADELFDGWSRERFAGVLPRPLCAQETTFYVKPQEDRPSLLVSDQRGE